MIQIFFDYIDLSRKMNMEKKTCQQRNEPLFDPGRCLKKKKYSWSWNLGQIPRTFVKFYLEKKK